MSNQQGDEFKVGDVVWCAAFGKGEVCDVSTQSERPVSVRYPDSFHVSYTVDGKLQPTSPRTLFFTEPKIEGSITRPFVPTLVGKTVCVQYWLGNHKYHHMGKVTAEQEHRFWINDLCKFEKSDVLDVREVCSENLLK